MVRALIFTRMVVFSALDDCGLAMEVIARAIDLNLDAMEVDVDTDAEHSSEEFLNASPDKRELG